VSAIEGGQEKLQVADFFHAVLEPSSPAFGREEPFYQQVPKPL
jgi:hypothetical protein